MKTNRWQEKYCKDYRYHEEGVSRDERARTGSSSSSFLGRGRGRPRNLTRGNDLAPHRHWLLADDGREDRSERSMSFPLDTDHRNHATS